MKFAHFIPLLAWADITNYDRIFSIEAPKGEIACREVDKNDSYAGNPVSVTEQPINEKRKLLTASAIFFITKKRMADCL